MVMYCVSSQGCTLRSESLLAPGLTDSPLKKVIGSTGGAGSQALQTQSFPCLALYYVLQSIA